jgi:undecaprenyl diphosphate synthase
MNFEKQVDKNKLPRHIAIIMDGNGRWAKKKGKLRVLGHEYGVKAVRKVVEVAAEIGIEFLTLYAFSTENWNRPQYEVDALMHLLVRTINKEIPTLQKNNIKLHAIGDIESLPDDAKSELSKAIEVTKTNNGTTMILALSYSARWEITNAARKIALAVKEGKIDPEQISKQLFSDHLNTVNIPDPELLIRTSGEKRISNFLLWQIAYTELYFTEKLWPDFGKEDFINAILDHQNRERRFGKISEQLRSDVT